MSGKLESTNSGITARVTYGEHSRPESTDVKLTDLDPRWAMDADIVIGGVSRHFDNRHGMCVSFECPHCVLREQQTGDKRVCRLAVWFANPIDGLPPTDDAKTLWQRTGDSFENLTLTPSIDASSDGHWHGFITNGAIV